MYNASALLLAALSYGHNTISHHSVDQYIDQLYFSYDIMLYYQGEG